MKEVGNMTKKLTLVAAAMAMLALSACSDMKKDLGLGRNSPDEFTVVKRAPLSLPPDYDLRPPVEGMAPPAADSSNQAKAALMGDSSQDAAPKGNAEDAFLQKAGADKANPAIRSVIGQDNGYLALKNEKLVDRLIFWNDEPPSDEDVPASVIDPKKEADRLKKNQEEGKPVNAGDVPVIEHKSSTFGKLF
jgi:hypothetical protein